MSDKPHRYGVPGAQVAVCTTQDWTGMCHRHSAFIMQATMGISEFPSGSSSTGSNMNRNRTRIIAILFLRCIRAVPQASAETKNGTVLGRVGLKYDPRFDTARRLWRARTRVRVERTYPLAASQRGACTSTDHH